MKLATRPNALRTAHATTRQQLLSCWDSNQRPAAATTALPKLVEIGLVGFEPTASWSRTRRSTKLSHSPNSLILPRRRGPYFAYFDLNRKERACLLAMRYPYGRSVLSMGLEITLCSPGQKALTTSRFIWKVNTHFYHARTATCSIRAYKQRVDYTSIPDGGGPPSSFLAPYDDSTSSGSSTGYPESATSD